MKCSCGKPISRHMKGMCIACRYAEIRKSRETKMGKVKPKRKVICRYCGKEFFPANYNVWYCSEECKKKNYQERMQKEAQKAVIKVCIRCNKEYEAKRYSTSVYCPECRELNKKGSKRWPTADQEARAEKMRRIKASGLTYGQYTSGKRPEEHPEYKGTIPANHLSAHWDEKEPVMESIVLHPHAKVRAGVDPHRLPARGIQRRKISYADQEAKGLRDGQKEIEEETQEDSGRYILSEML